MTSLPKTSEEHRRRLLAQPVVLAMVMFGTAILTTLTAPASPTPSGRIAVALLLLGNRWRWTLESLSPTVS